MLCAGVTVVPQVVDSPLFDFYFHSRVRGGAEGHAPSRDRRIEAGVSPRDLWGAVGIYRRDRCPARRNDGANASFLKKGA